MEKEDAVKVPTTPTEVLTTETPRTTTLATQSEFVPSSSKWSCKLDAGSPKASVLALSVTALGAGKKLRIRNRNTIAPLYMQIMWVRTWTYTARTRMYDSHMELFDAGKSGCKGWWI